MLDAKDHFDASTLVSSMRKDPVQALRASSSAILYGLFAWAVYVPFSMAIIYSISRVLIVNITYLKENPVSLVQLLFVGATTAVTILYTMHAPTREHASFAFLMVLLGTWAFFSYVKEAVLFHTAEVGASSYASLHPECEEEEPLAGVQGSVNLR